jgi:gas vesicle protein
MSECKGGSFMWFLFGLGIGATVGLLYAPKPGSETRDELFQRAEEGREVFINRAKQTAEQAQQWMDKGREVFEMQKEQFRSAFDAGKEAYREATGEGPAPTPSQS